MQNSAIIRTEDGKNYLSIPCDGDGFKDFISLALGEPQSIERGFSGSFTLDIKEINNVYHLVQQRVKQQNKMTLIQFHARLSYSDGSSVLIDGIEAMNSYHEVKPIVTQQLHLSWIYLVQFQDKDVPEKQKITLSFMASPRVRHFEIGETEAIFPGSIMTGRIAFRIEHSARTWGADIESLLSNYVLNLVAAENKVRKFIRRNSSTLSLLLFVFIISLAGTTCILYMNKAISGIKEKYASFKAASPNVEKTLDYIVDELSHGFWYKFLFFSVIYMFVALVVAMVISVWFAHISENERPAFIVFNKKDEEFRDKINRRYEKSAYHFFYAFAFAIVTGVIGNFVFSMIWNN